MPRSFIPRDKPFFRLGEKTDSRALQELVAQTGKALGVPAAVVRAMFQDARDAGATGGTPSVGSAYSDYHSGSKMPYKRANRPSYGRKSSYRKSYAKKRSYSRKPTYKRSYKKSNSSNSIATLLRALKYGKH